MPIRIPLKADIETQDAFRDVEIELSEIDLLRAEIEKLKIALRDSDDRLINLETPHTATYNVLPDTVIQGNLNVAGNLGVTGAVNAPGQIGGYVESVTPGIAGTSLAQPVVEVHGSLKVLSGLRADTAHLRRLTLSDDLTTPFSIPRVLFSSFTTVQSSGGSDIDGHLTSIDLTKWFSKAGDELLLESWVYVTASTWSIKHEINGVSYHTMTDLGFVGATLHCKMETRIIYITSSTQQIFTYFTTYNPGAGSGTTYQITTPTTSNTNASNTPGVGLQVIRERISDADNNLRTHGFKITVIPAL